jgi:hypothetical protein
VTFEVATQQIRPAEQSGQPIGGLRHDPAEGEASDTPAGVERRLFNQVVVAIMRAYRRTGSPTTAHAYYYLLTVSGISVPAAAAGSVDDELGPTGTRRAAQTAGTGANGWMPAVAGGWRKGIAILRTYRRTRSASARSTPLGRRGFARLASFARVRQSSDPERTSNRRVSSCRKWVSESECGPKSRNERAVRPG